MRDEFMEIIIGTAYWQDWEWRLMLKAIWERRRKRKLQRLSKQVIRWLHETSPSKLAKSSNQPSITHLAA